MIYIGETEQAKAALRKASERRTIRPLARAVYTDDFERGAEEIVEENILAIAGRLLPDWHVSHSSAALRAPVHGRLFMSGPSAVTGRNLALPGTEIVRFRQLPRPETERIQAPTQVSSGLQSPAQPVYVQISTPLQTIFECLTIARAYPEKTLPPNVLAEMIGRLASSDKDRAERFAARNNLRREYLRYRELSFGIATSAEVRVQEPDAFDLYFYGWRIGTLTHLGSNEYRFVYASEWKHELSPQLPLRSDGQISYEGRGMPAFMDNTLPEGWTERMVLASNKLSREDLFGLLATTRKYLSNLTLRPLDIPEDELTFDTLGLRLEDLPRAAPGTVTVCESIGRDPDDPELWRRTRSLGPLRVSGVQAKLPVSLVKESDGARLELGDLRHAATHILKFPSSELPGIVENEWASMELARRIGLNTADVAMVQFPKGSPYHARGRSLLVERYDIPDRELLARNDPEVRLLLQEDACSLLSLPREKKYETSMERIAGALLAAGLSNEAHANSFWLFLRQVLYSWIIGNGDLHAKNISVMRRFRPGELGRVPTLEQVDLTPLYDLVNTQLYIRGDDFAVPVDGRRQNLRPKNFVALAERWGGSRAEVLGAIDEVGGGVRSHLHDVLEESGMGKAHVDRYTETVERTLGTLGF